MRCRIHSHYSVAVVGALSAAVAYDVFGSYTLTMLLGAAGFAIGAIMLMRLPSPKPLSDA
jgi:hypothetical protein